MRRKSSAVYFDTDEHKCVQEAARQANVPVSEFAREATLLRAGWNCYPGPLFKVSAPMGERDQLPALIVHELLRLTATASRHVVRCFAERVPDAMPSEATLQALLKMSQQVVSYVESTTALRGEPQMNVWARKTAASAKKIADRNPIVGNTLYEHMMRVIARLEGTVYVAAAAARLEPGEHQLGRGGETSTAGSVRPKPRLVT